jgi:hypothetical protein
MIKNPHFPVSKDDLTRPLFMMPIYHKAAPLPSGVPARTVRWRQRAILLTAQGIAAIGAR